MKKYKGIEKRRYKRRHELLAVNIIGINNKIIHPKLDEEIGLNVSQGGVLIECSKRLAKTTRLKLKIMLTSDSKYKLILSPAVLVWNKRSFRDTYYLGCRFTRLKHKDRLFLRRFTSAP